MLMIYFLKPGFLYNKKTNKFKSFDDNIISVELIGFILPIIIYYSLHNITTMSQYKYLYEHLSQAQHLR
jgi:hypothetical protein